MRVYVLEWDNDLGWEDHRVTFLGAYSTAESREAAKGYIKQSDQYKNKDFPFRDTCGHFYLWSTEVDGVIMNAIDEGFKD